MLKPCTILPIAAISVLMACQTEQQTLSSGKDTATQTALQRGKFDMNCPTATAEVLSQEVVQPVVFGGKERTEYTVGVSGCNQRTSYVVACEANTSNCFALEPRKGS
jgi:hypothetical protein